MLICTDSLPRKDLPTFAIENRTNNTITTMVGTHVGKSSVFNKIFVLFFKDNFLVRRDAKKKTKKKTPILWYYYHQEMPTIICLPTQKTNHNPLTLNNSIAE